MNGSTSTPRLRAGIGSYWSVLVLTLAVLHCSRHELRVSTHSDERTNDVLLVNGKIFEHPAADALWIRDGRIAAIGEGKSLRRAVRPRTPVLDAQGGHVLPGFHDAHLHMEKGAATLHELRLEPGWSVVQVQAALAEYAAAHPQLVWLRGRGWGYNMVPTGQFPTRQMLDDVVPDRPVVLEAFDGHALWANTAALVAAHINAQSADPPSGRIMREDDGQTPAGVLLEEAKQLLLAAIPLLSIEERAVRLRAAFAHLLRLGITSVTDMSYHVDVLDVYKYIIAQDGELPLRVHVGLPLNGPIESYAALREQYPARRLSIGLLKGFLDGVVESRTAYMLAPYTGSHERGHPHFEQETLLHFLNKATSEGFSVALHGVGDGAVHMALSVIGSMPVPPLRPRLEHIEVLGVGDAENMARLGVIASMQPAHANPGGDHPEQGVWAENLGVERLRRTFAWRTLLRAGVTLAFGSDWPVVTADPLSGIAVAVTRQDPQGRPSGGWNSHEAIAWQDALRAYSAGAATAVARGAELGRLAVGYFGDIVVINPAVDFEIPGSLWPAEDEAKDQRVLYTIVEGQLVYANR